MPVFLYFGYIKWFKVVRQTCRFYKVMKVSQVLILKPVSQALFSGTVNSTRFHRMTLNNIAQFDNRHQVTLLNHMFISHHFLTWQIWVDKFSLQTTQHIFVSDRIIMTLASMFALKWFAPQLIWVHTFVRQVLIHVLWPVTVKTLTANISTPQPLDQTIQFAMLVTWPWLSPHANNSTQLSDLKARDVTRVSSGAIPI